MYLLFIIVTFVFYFLFMLFILWTKKPISSSKNDNVRIIIKNGYTTKKVAKLINEKFNINVRNFVWMTYIYNNDKSFKAGEYKLSSIDTPFNIMNNFVLGKCCYNQITFLEGWNFNQFRETLESNIYVRKTITNISDSDLMKLLGSQILIPEGLFHPDTYFISFDTTDFDILKMAYEKSNEIVSKLWKERKVSTTINTPYEAIILASIIEKEASNYMEKATISGVLNNRLKLGMRLQSDPTVIYGIGKNFSGKISKFDLKKDTPWNTYTRYGLPRSPISSVSESSLWAALNPELHNYIYYVARGDGTTVFSINYESHNSKVKEYLLKSKENK
ncbi:MAG: endolytic transglycosylase MltG [Candidatus Kinetoplastibacterium crithidii]|nr:MAG: endolytic transglycosylase MltG [Candidatus Kinetoplastibacterium crithidii]